MKKIKLRLPFFNKKKKEVQNSTLANPQEWLIRLLNQGTETDVGINVSAKSALQVSTVFACVKIISETISYLNCTLYERTEKGKVKAVYEDLYNILHNLPNEETVAFDFWVMYIVNLLLTGDAFAYIKRNKSGKIIELWNIPSQNVTIYRNKKTKELFYGVKIQTDEGEEKEIPYYPQNIMHTRGMRFDNANASLDPIKIARQAIGLGLALEKYASKYFSNGAQAGGIVEYPEAMSDPAFARFKEDFQKNYQGIINSNKIMFLEMGAKFNKVTNNPDESQAVESRQFQVVEVCRFFNVPPHKVFDLARATFSNIEQQDIDFVNSCIGPQTLRLEQTVYKDLLSTDDLRKRFFAKFNTNVLLRGDINSRRNFYQTMIQNGVFSPNDVRDFEDLNGIGPDGDQHFVNGSMIPLSMIGQQYTKGGVTNNE